LTTILFPVLLIIVALAVILILFGRHLPDIARGMKESKSRELAGSVDELPVGPKSIGLTRPLGNFWATNTGKLKKVFKFLIKSIVFASKKIILVASFVIKKILKVFHRVPNIRPVAGVFRRQKEGSDSFEEKDMSERHFSTLTTDIKIMPKNSLRYPEPIPEQKAKPTKKAEKKKVDADIQDEASEIVEEKKEGVYPEKLDNDKRVNVVEKTREIRIGGRRRFAGKVTAKPVSSVVSQEKNIKENDLVADVEKEPSVSLEAKKVSFIDKEGVALWDSTQEIGKMIQEGNYGRAESDLIDVLSKNPRNTEAYRLLGIVYLKRKDFAQAREVFEEALRRDPEHGGLQGPLGFCYMSMGEYGRALSMYQQALNMDEDNIEYLEQLLVISARMDRRPLVKMVAKKILAINPNHMEAKKYLERITA